MFESELKAFPRIEMTERPASRSFLKHRLGKLTSLFEGSIDFARTSRLPSLFALVLGEEAIAGLNLLGGRFNHLALGIVAQTETGIKRDNLFKLLRITA